MTGSGQPGLVCCRGAERPRTERPAGAVAEIHRVLTDPNASWEATMRASEAVLDLCYGKGGSA